MGEDGAKPGGPSGGGARGGASAGSGSSTRRARVQVRRTVAGGWTPAKRIAFLDRLAATSNVAASARAVGMLPRGAHALRARDPVFAAAWVAAIEAAYETLEARLLEYALGDAGAGSEADRDGDRVAGRVVDGVADGVAERVVDGVGDGAGGDRRGAHFDPRVAVQALGLRRREGGAAAGAAGKATCKRVSVAEVEAALIAKLDAIERGGSIERGGADRGASVNVETEGA